MYHVFPMSDNLGVEKSSVEDGGVGRNGDVEGMKRGDGCLFDR